MKNTTIMLLTAGLISIICLSGQARAHFGMIIPSDSMVGQQDSNVLTLTLSFSHPFEGVGMELVKPKPLKRIKMVFSPMQYRHPAGGGLPP